MGRSSQAVSAIRAAEADKPWLRLECLKLASDRTMKLSMANDKDALIALARQFYAYVDKG